MKAILAFAALLASGMVCADGTTYKWVDEHGHVHYSDQPPPPNAKKVEEKKIGGNYVETSELPYQLREAVKKYPVTLYATDCGEFCDKARELLRTRGVPYSEKDPQRPGQSEELKKLIGGLQVPVLQVGQSKVLKGFEQAAWHRELDAAGYPKTSVLPTKAPVKKEATSN
jgi:glutaredoxin